VQFLPQMHQKLFGGRVLEPLGELTSYNAPSDPLAGFKG